MSALLGIWKHALNRSAILSIEQTVNDLPQPLTGAELVGRGFTADIYAWGPGRVVKLFHEWVPDDRAEREYRITCAVHAAGLPAPAPYELVTVGDRQGIVFERVNGASMLTRFQKTPWRIFPAVRQLAVLQAQIHAIPGPAELPSQRERLAERITNSPFATAAAKEAALAALADLPDGTATCHGDFHPENVLLTAGGPMVIDWGAASRGDPLGDVACTARLMRTANLPPWTPGYMHVILKCSRVLMHRYYTRHFLQLHGATKQQIRRWDVPLDAAATILRLAETQPDRSS